MSTLCKLCGSSNIFLLHRFSGREIGEFIPRFNRTYRKNFIKILDIAQDDTFLLICCRLCDFAFISNPLPLDKLRKLYEGAIDSSLTEVLSVKSEHRNFFLNIWLDMLPTIKTGRVLDVGCGWGEFLRIGLALGFSCYGYEFDRGKYPVLREQGIRMIEGLDRSNTKFDFILLNQVLEHVVDPKSLLISCHRLLVPGGKMLVAVPNFSSLGSVLTHLREGEMVTKTLNPLEHINYFTPRTLHRVLRTAGFLADDYLPLCFENWTSVGGIIREIVKLFLRVNPKLSPLPRTTMVICRKNQ